MKTTINQRFAKILEEKNILPIEYARKIGKSKQLVSSWTTDTSQISLDRIVEFLELYPDIDARWLLTGSPREYNIDHPITMVEEKTATFISGDKDYIIQLQKELINNLKKDNARLTQDIAGDSLPKRDIAV